MTCSEIDKFCGFVERVGDSGYSREIHIGCQGTEQPLARYM